MEATSTDGCSGRELLEKEVLETMRKEGFSNDQIYDMPLLQLFDLFYDAYLLRANHVLAAAASEASMKKLLTELENEKFV
jgi:hypothetical protein